MNDKDEWIQLTRRDAYNTDKQVWLRTRFIESVASYQDSSTTLIGMASDSTYEVVEPPETVFALLGHPRVRRQVKDSELEKCWLDEQPAGGQTKS
jgi:hypothetical protein